MTKDKEYFIELIYEKLKNNNSRKTNLKKKELTEFINSLINNNEH